ncbi:hypothetical protein A3A75_00615 [Candidatus Woesebacteria bacterium RIFCSPLOWO2_01_FULL_39_10]|uniref:ROK family protein n=1 Tax=Candidatus Woesebacteria bacterium RIFCSPLOWO2_01_FULL_39_10 TaxID=1802516 RepID=A0A1F8B418_9BACT|nr:MAG: hypothetical protein A3A75_00615 [Candidatus Woesebacteria bacterium RIFCSPLOWO2_01_FULL_39_10]
MDFLFDVGGTKMRLASSYDGENFHEVKVYRTPSDFEEGMKIFKEFIDKTDTSSVEKCVCCGLAGVLDKDKKMLVSAPNLSGWIAKPIKQRLLEMTNAKVFLENDADLGGLAEAVKGAGRGYSIVSYLTVGTGVGGVRIVDQNIDRSTSGFEPGHQFIDTDGSLFTNGSAGRPTTLEDAVSGTALKLRFNKAPEEITDSSVWLDFEKYLAIGIANTIVHWSPEVVVLGGGVMQVSYISIERIFNNVREVVKIFPQLPEIKKGILGDEVGLYGALIQARHLR